MRTSTRVVYGVAAFLSLLSLAAPVKGWAYIEEEEGGAKIKCEKCTCNMGTGICDCTGCTITPS